MTESGFLESRESIESGEGRDLLIPEIKVEDHNYSKDDEAQASTSYDSVALLENVDMCDVSAEDDDSVSNRNVTDDEVLSDGNILSKDSTESSFEDDSGSDTVKMPNLRIISPIRRNKDGESPKIPKLCLMSVIEKEKKHVKKKSEKSKSKKHGKGKGKTSKSVSRKGEKSMMKSQRKEEKDYSKESEDSDSDSKSSKSKKDVEKKKRRHESQSEDEEIINIEAKKQKVETESEKESDIDKGNNVFELDFSLPNNLNSIVNNMESLIPKGYKIQVSAMKVVDIYLR